MSAPCNGFAEYEARFTAFENLKAEVMPGNKAALFLALAAADIAIVHVEFDGCGDSGQIESISAADEQGAEKSLDGLRAPFQKVHLEGLTVAATKRAVEDICEIMAYDFLQQTHSGWENSDGAQGTFTFDVAGGVISLEYNERYTAHETFIH